MGFMTRIRDGLANVMSGAGTAADKRMHAAYVMRPLDRSQIDAMYRSSWLMRKIVDLPPYDMTRAGRDWQAEKPDIAKLEEVEKKHAVWAKLRAALILGRLGGGAIVIGADGLPSEPLIEKAKLRYLYVCSRWHLTIGQIVTDPESDFFGQPDSFRLNNGRGEQLPIHPSRVIAFKGAPIADVGLAWGSDDWFWGDSVLQHVQDAVRNADMAQGGFASLIDEAKLDIIKVPELMASVGSAEYENRLLQRFSVAAMGKSTHNALIIDGGEEWQQRQITWAGMPDIIRTYLSIVAGAADIPATRLLGKSADGMNATGEGDERNYWAMIGARQESDLRPALDILDPLLAATAGVATKELWSTFAPLATMSEAELATINKTKAETVQIYANAGLVPTEALEASVQNMLTEDAWLPGLDTALDAIPEDERFPSRMEPEANGNDPNEIVDPATEEGGDPIRLRRAANDSRKDTASDSDG